MATIIHFLAVYLLALALVLQLHAYDACTFQTSVNSATLFAFPIM